jgi:riboflavin kinase / FMN adenylyltransferase
VRLIETISDIGELKANCVLTIGNFDGVHLGHQKILGRARQIADDRASELVVLTFEPHPLAVLHPEIAPEILTPICLKKILLNQCGVDCRLVIKSSKEILSLSPEDFLQQFLIEKIKPSVVVEGKDFTFGRKSQGSIETLKMAGYKYGFEVEIVDEQKAVTFLGEEIKISSTIIRYMLQSGKVKEASTFLGRDYRLIGKIISGRGKGRQIGYPTLNMQKPPQVIPAEGVYAGFVITDKTEDKVCENANRLQAVFSLGQARTFGDTHQLLIEAHVLENDFSKPAGEYMAMDFVEQIRSQHKFSSVEELKKQIEKDCRDARQILKNIIKGKK